MAEYISKGKLKQIIKNQFSGNLLLGLLLTIDSLPAADVNPVAHGRKIEDGDIGCFWLCSLCGECLPYGANYCPSCGAKMDEGEDNATD